MKKSNDNTKDSIDCHISVKQSLNVGWMQLQQSRVATTIEQQPLFR